MDSKQTNRKVKKLTFKGKFIEDLIPLNHTKLSELLTSRARRSIRRRNGFSHSHQKLALKIKKSKLNLQPGEKPKTIKTHSRNAIITPEMVGGVVGVYNGKEYREVEVKFDMIGRFMGEFSLTYKPTLRKAAINEKGTKKGGK